MCVIGSEGFGEENEGREGQQKKMGVYFVAVLGD